MNGCWNPWHGCKKYSEGCKNCYVYRRDEEIGKDASIITKTADFSLPLKKDRNGNYKIKSGETVFTCMTSDFFIEEADGWRDEIWQIIKKRNDVFFMIITKRIVRFKECIPDDWGNGYDNVGIICTVESQKQCDIRLPIFNELPIKHKFIGCEPLLTDIDMKKYLSPEIIQVSCGGESGIGARECNFDWVLHIREQCIENNVKFHFKQTGANFTKDGKNYKIERKYQSIQAKKANINT